MNYLMLDLIKEREKHLVLLTGSITRGKDYLYLQVACSTRLCCHMITG